MVFSIYQQDNFSNFSDNSSVHISSRIIQNDGYNIDFNNRIRGSNYNKKCMEYFISNIDYKDKSKLNIINYIENKFFDYLDYLSFDKKGIVLSDIDKNFLIRYNTKFSNHYAEKVKRRMDFLSVNNANMNCVLLTLTLNPEKYDNLVEMWLSIKKEQNRFMTRIKQILRDKGIKDIKYLSIIECQKGTDIFNKKGESVKTSWLNPHIHIVFFGLKRLMDWRKIESIWNNGYIWINRAKDNKKIRKPIDYITKYITKTDTDRFNIRNQAIQWFFNVRSFSYSKGLVFPLNYSVNNSEFLCNVYCDSKYILNWFEDNLESIFSKFNYYDVGG